MEVGSNMRKSAAMEKGASMPINFSKLEKLQQQRLKSVLGMDTERVKRAAARPDASKGVYMVAHTCIVRNSG